MILHHITQSTRLVIEASSALDTHVLHGGDLYPLDVVTIPEGLEDPVGEAERHDVLHRLLAEEVVDTVELMLVEGRSVDLVQL